VSWWFNLRWLFNRDMADRVGQLQVVPASTHHPRAVGPIPDFRFSIINFQSPASERPTAKSRGPVVENSRLKIGN
jgi:hypothetical protein